MLWKPYNQNERTCQDLFYQKVKDLKLKKGNQEQKCQYFLQFHLNAKTTKMNTTQSTKQRLPNPYIQNEKAKAKQIHKAMWQNNRQILGWKKGYRD